MLRYFFKKKVLSPEEQMAEWEKKGRPAPPPHIVKQMTIDEYRKKFGMNVLIETGTFLGEMIEAHKNNFKKIFSIELGEKLFEKAKKKFRGSPHIHLLQGDSGIVLHKLMPEIDEPVLFWLDGHYSEGITALGEKECPVREELDAILPNKFKHVILIDDARMFNGTHDYPTIEEIKKILENTGKKFDVEIKDDIIRITQ